MTQTAIFTGNHVLNATVTAPEVVTLAMHFDKEIYAVGDGAEERLSGRLKNPNPAYPFMTAEMSPIWSIDVDFGAAVDVDLIALIGHNISTAGAHVITLSSDAAHTTVLFSAEVEGDGETSLLVVPPATVSARYLRLWAADPTRLYLALGALGVWTARTFDWGADFGLGWTDRLLQPRQQGGAGSMLYSHRGKYGELSVSLPDILVDEVQHIIDMANGEPLLFTYDWTRDDVVFAGQWIYGLQDDRQTRRFRTALNWDSDLTITELRPALPEGGLDLLSAGVRSQISANVSSVDLGSLNAGETAETVIRLSTPGQNVEAITVLVTAPDGFDMASTASFVMQPGQSFDIELSRSITQDGDLSGDLVIAHSSLDTVSPITIPISLTGSGTRDYAVFDNSASHEGTNNCDVTVGGGGSRVDVRSNGNWEYTDPSDVTRRAIGGSINSPSSGKRYVEITFDQTDAREADVTGTVIALATAAVAVSTDLRADEDIGGYAAWITSEGELGYRLPALWTTDALPLWNNGTQVIGIAADIDAGKIWWRRNGIWMQGEPGSDVLKVLPIGQAFNIRVWTYDNHETRFNINAGEEAWTYDPPAGYLGWYSLS